MADKQGLQLIGITLAALTAGTMTMAAVVAYKVAVGALAVQQSMLMLAPAVLPA